MKKFLLIFAACWLMFSTWAQTENELWLSGGAKYSFTKKLDFSGELNLRMEPVVLNTFFTEFSAKYQVTKWFKPSLDYRIVLDRNNYGNYKASQRLNLNANFGTEWKRFDFGMRVRLQTTLTNVRTPESNFSDLAPGWRIKPDISYNIKKSIIIPTFSTEFFFKRDDARDMIMNKVRIAAGADFDVIGPYNIGIKYMYGYSLYSPKYEHIISLSFTQKYKSEAAKKKKK